MNLVHVQQHQRIKVVVINSNLDKHQRVYRKKVHYLDRMMVRQSTRRTSESSRFFLGKEMIQLNEDNDLYKEIILKQHSVPLSDLMQINES